MQGGIHKIVAVNI